MPAWFLPFVAGFGCGVVSVLVWAVLSVASESSRAAMRAERWERLCTTPTYDKPLRDKANGD